MNRRLRSSGLRPRLLGALAAVLLVPGLARSEALQFRNDTREPVIVQGGCLVRGALVRDRPYLVHPNDKSPPISLPGGKVIWIYDAKVPNRVLLQQTIPAGTEDQLFSIQPDAAGTRVRLEKARPKRP
jgi:hypothetical protein